MKISPKDPGAFELPDPGDYTFRGKRAAYRAPQDTTQGWIYQVWSTIEGGEFDGNPHFESFFTRSQFGDGLDGCRALLKLLVSMGRVPEAVANDFDSDKFETQGFADKFETMVVDSLFGGTLGHKLDKKTGQKWARITKYFVPNKPKTPEKKGAAKNDKEFEF